jgi:hypothetical protein
MVCAAIIACSSAVSTVSTIPTLPAPPLPAPVSTLDNAPAPDARIALKGGLFDAGEVIWNLEKVSSTKPAAAFIPPVVGTSAVKSSDLAFKGTTVFQGNYSGWQAWDISDPKAPVVKQAFACPGAQSDVSIYGNLLFVSHEAPSARIDCGTTPIGRGASRDRALGVRIIDVSNLASPKVLAVVQTCRGSHTHTVVTDPNDKANVYIYVSGSSGVRAADDMPGCAGGQLRDNPNSAQYRIEVIQVPLANPASARIINSPHILADLGRPPRHAEPARGGGRGAAADTGGGRGRGRGNAADTTAAGRGNAGRAGTPPVAGRGGGVAPPATGRGATDSTGRGGRGAAPPANDSTSGGPSGCHDITTYPALGLAGGACGGYGLLLDIRDPKNPKRLAVVSDSNMSFWHSATFSNDGSKILFSDEWGGGTNARCRLGDNMAWGANALFTIENSKMVFKSYYKIPTIQTDAENCVAHNGSLIPVPGRDIMVQAWYQGGISVFDWTDAARPKEIAYFDRGPMTPTLVAGGFWSAYWYNGHIIGSEEFRGLDIFALKPSAHLSQNEIDAAKSVKWEQLNPQEQPKITWAPSFAVVRSYLDQLGRGNGIAPNRGTTIAGNLVAAERATGAERRSILNALAAQLDRDAATAADAKKVRTMAAATRDLANVTR